MSNERESRLGPERLSIEETAQLGEGAPSIPLSESVPTPYMDGLEEDLGAHPEHYPDQSHRFRNVAIGAGVLATGIASWVAYKKIYKGPGHNID